MPGEFALIDPIALRLGPVAVHWYGIILTTAIVVAAWQAYRESRLIGLNPEFVLDLSMWAVPAAIVGARLYEVFVLQWDYYRANLREIPAIWHGGMAIHGSIIASILVGYLFVRRRRQPFWLWADICLPSLILGQAIGRWGNFVNQEAYGGPAPAWVMGLLPPFIREGMLIGGQFMHPTFLYESIWNFTAFAALAWLRRTNPQRGTVALSYVFLYGLGRLLIEGIRMDSSFVAGGFRVAQIASLAMVLLAAAVYLWRRPRVGERYLPSPEEAAATH